MPRATEALMMARRGSIAAAPIAPVKVICGVKRTRCIVQLQGNGRVKCDSLCLRRMRMRRLCLTLCCSLLLALPRPVLAQETTATVTGTVTDQSGGVLPGVVVAFKHAGTGHIYESTTNTEGQYRAPLLPVGTYEATFTLSGFQTRTVRGIALNVNDRALVDAQLSAGGVSEVVEVTGKTLTQTTTSVQTLIDSQQVQELPINNRNFAKLAELAPCVSSDLADEATFGLTSTMSI